MIQLILEVEAPGTIRIDGQGEHLSSAGGGGEHRAGGAVGDGLASGRKRVEGVESVGVRGDAIADLRRCRIEVVLVGADGKQAGNGPRRPGSLVGGIRLPGFLVPLRTVACAQ